MSQQVHDSFHDFCKISENWESHYEKLYNIYVQFCCSSATTMETLSAAKDNQLK